MLNVLRAILVFALLLGSGAAGWAPVPEPAHESCCCGTPAGLEDRCPCPKPEGNRPSSGACSERQSVVALWASRAEQAQRRRTADPTPVGWRASSLLLRSGAGTSFAPHGRDPDLGRHLARLGTLRI